jgi:hypothetical protein
MSASLTTRGLHMRLRINPRYTLFMATPVSRQAMVVLWHCDLARADQWYVLEHNGHGTQRKPRTKNGTKKQQQAE